MTAPPTNRIDLTAVPLAARTEILEWLSRRLEVHRKKLESPRCEDTDLVRGRIAEIRELQRNLDGNNSPKVKDDD